MAAITDARARLLPLNHEIRKTESALHTARQRRWWSNVSLTFGPPVLILLYALWWIPGVEHRILLVIYVPAGIISFLFLVATVKLKLTAGGPPTGPFELLTVRPREKEDQLELQLARQREERNSLLASEEMDTKVRRVYYKEDTYADVDRLRSESGRWRRVNNILQGILIIGSLTATGTSALTAEVPDIRWVTLGVTSLVGIASGFMGYFKYKERSFYLQQTADAIESEWEAVELSAGHYKHMKTEDERLAEFVEVVHRLKTEQKQRQQNLDQPEARSTQNQ